MALTLTWVPMLVVSGEIDSSNVDEFRNALSWHEGNVVHIDAARVEFCGSECLRVLVDLCAREIDVHVWHPSPLVLRVLDVSRVAELLTIHN